MLQLSPYFCLAVKKNFAGIAKSLIAAGAPVNAVSKGGLSVLHFATESRNPKLVELLIKSGASVNHQAENGLHCLHLCSQQGLVNIANILIQNRAVLNPETKSEYTPLHTASFLGQTKMVEFLVKKGALVNSQTKRGKTPLFLAAERGYLKVAQCLLANKAEDVRDKSGKSALAVAIIQGNNNMVELLKRFGFSEDYGNLDADSSVIKPNLSRAKSKSVAQLADLHTACRNGYVATVKKILQQGADPNERSKHDLTPLHISVHYNMLHIIKILLENGADPNAKAQNGYTPLAIACSNNQVQVAQTLLQHNADPDIESNRGITPLMLAAKDGNAQLLQLLLSSSASVNKQANNGVSALHLCCQEDNLSVARTLVDKGADVTLKTNAGYDPVATCAHFGSVNTLKFLTKHGCQLNVTSRKGRTPLMEAAEQGHLEACQILLANGAIASLKDDQLDDALTIAQKHSHANLCKIFEPMQEFGLSPQKLDDSLGQENKSIPSEFLTSFSVDAKGSVFQGSRDSGCRIIIPPKRVSKPTRITCKLVDPEKVTPLPQLKYGENLATKIIEMNPPQLKFNGPILVEIPHFASPGKGDREFKVLAYGKNKEWREHLPEGGEKEQAAISKWLATASDQAPVAKTNVSKETSLKVFTKELPQYFAVISRTKVETLNVKQANKSIRSAVDPKVAITVPEDTNADINIQLQKLNCDLAKSLGEGVILSPMVILEPSPDTWPSKQVALSLPFPENHLKSTNNLKLLTLQKDIWSEVECSKSIDPGDKNVANFSCAKLGNKTFAVVAPPHLDCKLLAQEVNKSAGKVPYMANFVVYSKKDEGNQAKMHVTCASGNRNEIPQDLLKGYWEVARSTDLEMYSTTKYMMRIHGNLQERVPNRSSFIFNPFHDDHLPLDVTIKDLSQPPVAGLSIWQEVRDNHEDFIHVCNINMQIPESFEPIKTEVTESQADMGKTAITPVQGKVEEGNMYLVQKEGVQEIVILEGPKATETVTPQPAQVEQSLPPTEISSTQDKMQVEEVIQTQSLEKETASPTDQLPCKSADVQQHVLPEANEVNVLSEEAEQSETEDELALRCKALAEKYKETKETSGNESAIITEVPLQTSSTQPDSGNTSNTVANSLTGKGTEAELPSQTPAEISQGDLMNALVEQMHVSEGEPSIVEQAESQKQTEPLQEQPVVEEDILMPLQETSSESIQARTEKDIDVNDTSRLDSQAQGEDGSKLSERTMNMPNQDIEKTSAEDVEKSVQITTQPVVDQGYPTTQPNVEDLIQHDVVEKLLSEGASITAESKTTVAAKPSTSKEKHEEIVKTFTEANAEEKQLEVVESLIISKEPLQESQVVIESNLVSVSEETLQSSVSQAISTMQTEEDGQKSLQDQLKDDLQSAGLNAMKRQDTLMHETSYDEIPSSTEPPKKDVMSDSTHSSDDALRAVSVETIQGTDPAVQTQRTTRLRKKLETAPSTASETDDFTTDDEMPGEEEDDDRVLNVLDEEQLALLNKLTAATKPSDVTEDDIVNIEILELFLSNMQESLETSVDESLKKAEHFIDEYTLSDKNLEKLQGAVMNAVEALDAAAAMPLTVDENDDRETTPTNEDAMIDKALRENREIDKTDSVLERKYIKERHGYDQEFELNRVTQLASIAQLAQVEMQKRISKKQSQTDVSVDEQPTAGTVDPAEAKKPPSELTPEIIEDVLIIETSNSQESAVPDRNIRASSHEAMCETEEILSQIFAKADQDIETNREEMRHVRAQSTNVVRESRMDNEESGDATLPRHARARSHEAASEMEETLSQIFGKALTLSQDMIAKETRSPSSTREIPSKGVSPRVSVGREITGGTPRLRRKSPMLKNADEDQSCAQPVDAKTYAVLESTLDLEKDKNTPDIATASLQNKPKTRVAQVDAPKLVINKAEDEDSIIAKNIALVTDPELEWKELVGESPPPSPKNILAPKEPSLPTVDTEPINTKNAEQKSVQKISPAKDIVETQDLVITEDKPMVAKDGKWLIGDESYSPVKKATSMQEIPTKRFGDLTENEKKKVQKAGSGIIVDDPSLGDKKESIIKDKTVNEKISDTIEIKAEEQVSHKKSSQLSLTIEQSIVDETSSMVKISKTSKKESSPETPTEVSDEWAKLIQESINEAKAELGTSPPTAIDETIVVSKEEKISKSPKISVAEVQKETLTPASPKPSRSITPKPDAQVRQSPAKLQISKPNDQPMGAQDSNESDEIIRHMIDVQTSEVEKISKMKLAILQELREKEALLKRMEEEECNLKKSLEQLPSSFQMASNKSMKGSVSETNLSITETMMKQEKAKVAKQSPKPSPSPKQSPSMAKKEVAVKADSKKMSEQKQAIVTVESSPKPKKKTEEKAKTSEVAKMKEEKPADTKQPEKAAASPKQSPVMAKKEVAVKADSKKVSEQKQTIVSVESSPKQLKKTEEKAKTAEVAMTKEEKPTDTKQPEKATASSPKGSHVRGKVSSSVTRETIVINPEAMLEAEAQSASASATVLAASEVQAQKDEAAATSVSISEPAKSETITVTKVEAETKPTSVVMDYSESLAKITSQEKTSKATIASAQAVTAEAAKTTSKQVSESTVKQQASKTEEKTIIKEQTVAASEETKPVTPAVVLQQSQVTKVEKQVVKDSKEAKTESQVAKTENLVAKEPLVAKETPATKRETQATKSMETVEYEAISSKIVQAMETKDIFAFKDEMATTSTMSMVVASANLIPGAVPTSAAAAPKASKEMEAEEEEEEELQVLQILNPFVIGQSARLLGEVDPQEPRARTTWFKDKQQIPLPSRRFLTILKGNTRQFIIHNVQEEDMGFYEMRVNDKTIASVFLGEMTFRF